MYGAEVPSLANLLRCGVTFRFRYSGRKASYEMTKSAGSVFVGSVPHIPNGILKNKNKSDTTDRIMLQITNALFAE